MKFAAMTAASTKGRRVVGVVRGEGMGATYERISPGAIRVRVIWRFKASLR
jgi:hypothetical protein